MLNSIYWYLSFLSLFLKIGYSLLNRINPKLLQFHFSSSHNDVVIFRTIFQRIYEQNIHRIHYAIRCTWGAHCRGKELSIQCYLLVYCQIDELLKPLFSYPSNNINSKFSINKLNIDIHKKSPKSNKIFECSVHTAHGNLCYMALFDALIEWIFHLMWKALWNRI